MARKTMAPTLHRTVIAEKALYPQAGRRAAAELRALLAVALAAEAWNALHLHDSDATISRKDCPGCRLDRALARLRRASGGKP